MQCGSHICSVICQICVQCSLSHLVDCSDLIVDMYICIHLSFKACRDFADMAYNPYLGDIFSSIYVAVPWEVCIVLAMFLAHVQKRLIYWSLFHVDCVWCKFAVCLSYLFSNMYQICVHWHWQWPPGSHLLERLSTVTVEVCWDRAHSR